MADGHDMGEDPGGDERNESKSGHGQYFLDADPERGQDELPPGFGRSWEIKVFGSDLEKNTGRQCGILKERSRICPGEQDGISQRSSANFV